MSFEDIRGQDRALTFLRDVADTGRISHAYIFYGPDGVGKKLAALTFAKAVNCGAYADQRPCGVCGSCRKIASLNHPDLFLLRPEKELSPIRIDEIRALIKDIGLKPYEGRKKFYILDEARRMTEEASNSLLKTLEEPPSDSVLILITETLGSLLSTIVSRSQAVKFFALSRDEVRGILVEKHGIDAGRAHVLSHLSSGSPGRAVAYNNEVFFSRREKVLAALASGTFFESDFDKLTKTDLKAYLSIILTWYRDMLIVKAGGSDEQIMNIDTRDVIARQAQKLTYTMIENAIARVLSTGSYVDKNANPKLAMAALATIDT